MQFDGVDDRITVAHDTALDGTGAGGITVSAVVNMSELPGGIAYRIIDKFAADTSGWEMSILPDGTFQVTLGSGGGNYIRFSSDTPLAPDEFNHLGFTYDNASGEFHAYKNGAEFLGTIADQVAAPLTMPADTAGALAGNTNAIVIGDGGDFSNLPMKGTIDEVRVYDQALSATDVADVAGGGNVGATPLIDYDFSDGTAANGGTLGAAADGIVGTPVAAATPADHELSFNGTVITSTAANATIDAMTSVTFEANVTMDVLPGVASAYRIVEKLNAGTYNGWEASITDSGQLQVTIGGVNNQTDYLRFTSTGAVFAAGTEVHIAFTYDGLSGALTAYADGVAIAGSIVEDGAVSGSPENLLTGTSTVGVSLGYGPAYSNYGLQGDIDDVRIYDNARSAGQIAQDAAGGNLPANSAEAAAQGEGLLVYVNVEDVSADGQTIINKGTLGTGGDFILGSTTSTEANDPTVDIENVGVAAAIGETSVARFDGIDDFVQADTTGINFAGPFSIELVLQTTQATVGYLTSIGDATTTNQDTLITINEGAAGTIRVGQTGQAGAGFVDSAVTVNDGQPHHISYTHDGAGNFKLYVDGVLEATYSGTVPDGTGADLLLAQRMDGAIPFEGQIGDFRIYSDERSPGEVAQDAAGDLSGDNLQVHYDFEPTNVSDGIVENQGLLLTSADATMGKPDILLSQGMRFDGVDDKLVATDPLLALGGGAFTIEAVFSTQSIAAVGSILSLGDSLTTSGGINFDVFDTAGTIVVGAGLANVGGPPANTFPINDGTPHHVAMTFDGTTGNGGTGTYEFFLDGVSLGTFVNDSQNISLGQLTIGSRDDGSAPFDGLIDDVRIYDGVRTDAEIAADAVGTLDAGALADANLLVAYDFEAVNISPTGAVTNLGTIGTFANASPGIAAQPALSFDGGDIVTASDAGLALGTGDFTIEAVFSVSAPHGAFRTIMSLGSFGGDQGAALGVNASGQIQGINSFIGGPSDTVDITDGQPHHVAMVRSGANLSLYVDGDLIGTTTDAGSLNITNGQVALGSFPTLNDPFFGVIGEVRVYGDARTAAEIALDALGETTGDALLVHYDMDPANIAGSALSNLGSLSGADGTLGAAAAEPMPTTITNTSAPNVEDMTYLTDGTEPSLSITVDPLQPTTVPLVDQALSFDGTVSIDVTDDSAFSLLNAFTFDSAAGTITAGTANSLADLAIGDTVSFIGTSFNNVTFTITGNDGTTLSVAETVIDEGVPSATVTSDSESPLATGTGEFTYEAWFRTDSPANPQTIIRVGDPSGAYAQIRVTGDGRIQALAPDAGPTVLESALGHNDGLWHHVAFTYDNSGNLALVVDGEVVATNATSISAIDVGDVTIGGYLTANQPFEGEIFDVRAYDVARTQADIIGDMNTLPDGTDPNLTGAWHLDDEFDDVAHTFRDISGNGATGSFAGGTPTFVDTNMLSVAEDSVLHGRINATDADNAAETFTYGVTAQGANGTVVVNPDGTWTYTPAADYVGPDSFEVSVTDSLGAVTTKTVTVDVKNVNDAPEIANLDGDTLTFGEGDGPLLLDTGTLANVTDIDSTDFFTGALTVSIGAGLNAGEDLLGLQTGNITLSVDMTAGSVVYVHGFPVGTLANTVDTGADLIINFDYASGRPTPADVSEILRALTYENTSAGTPDTTPRTVNVSLTDAQGAESAIASITVISNVIEGTGGNDALSGTAGKDVILGLAGDDTLSGLAGDDKLVGGDGADTLDGGSGVNVLIGGAGDDFLTGGTGGTPGQDINIASYTNATGAINAVFNGGSGNFEVSGDASVGTDTLGVIDRLVGSDFADTFDMSSGWNNSQYNSFSDATIGSFNEVRGGAGDDTITGNGATRVSYADATDSVTVTLTGGGGGTAISTYGGDLAGIGNDTFVSGVAEIRGSDHNDTLIGDANNNVLIGGAGNDTLDGGGGGGDVDRADYRSASGAITVDLTLGSNQVTNDGEGNSDTLIDIEQIRGSRFDDYFIGDGGSTRFRGDLGADSFSGGGGADRFEYTIGSAESNINSLDEIQDFNQIDGDTIRFNGMDGMQMMALPYAYAGSLSATIAEIAGNGGLTDRIVFFEDGVDGYLYVNGAGVGPTSYDGTLIRLWGQLTPLALNDVRGNGGAAVPIDASIIPTLDGVYEGDATANVIVGTAADEVFIGHTGQDTLTGGGGADAFVYLADTDSPDSTPDTIVDFEVGIDKIVLEGIIPSDFSFSYMAGSLFSNTPNQAEARFVDGSNLLEIDIDGSGTADMAITLTGITAAALSLADFAIIKAGQDGISDYLILTAGDDLISATTTMSTAMDIGSIGSADSLDLDTGIETLIFRDPLELYGAELIGTDLAIFYEDTTTGYFHKANIVGHTIDPLDFVEFDFDDDLPGNETFAVEAGTTATATSGGDPALFGTMLIGTSGIDTLTGDAGNDILLGNAGDDTLIGNDGDDFLIGGAGVDDYQGGAGNDTVSFFDVPSVGVVVDLSGGSTNNDGFGNDETFTSIENIEGSSYDDTIIGDAGANFLAGEDGYDILDGGDGDDVLDGGYGSDFLAGGAGADTLTGGEGSDAFIYTSASESSTGALRDVITDFDANFTDQIDLFTLINGDFGFLGDETQVFDGFSAQARFNNQTKILEIDSDGDTTVDMEIELQNVDIADLDDSDFVVNNVVA
jgi:VCBS repeat-containing protein